MDIPEQEITKLADNHGMNLNASYLGGFDFQQSMNLLSWRYQLMSGLKYDGAEVKRQTDNLAKKANGLIKAIDDFDDVLRRFSDLSENPAEKKLPILRRDVEARTKQVRANAKLWAEAADQAKAEQEKHKSRRGPIGNPAFNFAVRDLIRIFEAGKEVQAGRSYDSEAKIYTGPLYRFIEDCLDILGIPKKTNKRLGKAIENQIKIVRSLE